MAAEPGLSRRPRSAPALNAVIDESAQAAGREPSAVRRLLNIGPGETDRDSLADLALADGVSAFILASDDPAQIERYGREVAPQVRALVAVGRAGVPDLLPGNGEGWPHRSRAPAAGRSATPSPAPCPCSVRKACPVRTARSGGSRSGVEGLALERALGSSRPLRRRSRRLVNSNVPETLSSLTSPQTSDLRRRVIGGCSRPRIVALNLSSPLSSQAPVPTPPAGRMSFAMTTPSAMKLTTARPLIAGVVLVGDQPAAEQAAAAVRCRRTDPSPGDQQTAGGDSCGGPDGLASVDHDVAHHPRPRGCDVWPVLEPLRHPEARPRTSRPPSGPRCRRSHRR